ncbi:peptidoglycan-binding protein [Brevibacterium linens]|uniref:peptidoglycan-binding protein n=1 Tax=Brevibacterium linens TaxID=1703 RepID=UPI003BF4A7C1
MGQKQDIIKIARSQIGVKESPAGSNRVKYTAWYPMIGPWCAMFVSWCADQAGIPTSIIPKHAYTPLGKNWFTARDQWGTKPVVGAIAYYNLSGLGRISHVGIVIKVYSNGSFDAIEGNTDVAGGRTGGKVMIKRRKAMGAGGGFGYPRYNGKPTKPKGASTGTSVYESASAQHEIGSRVMRKYSGGSDVDWLQRRLYKIGYTITPKSDGTFDKHFGPEVEKAVRALQSKAKIKVDGEAGQDTIAAAKAAEVVRQLPAKKATVKKTDPFPLKSGHWYGATAAKTKNHSGYYQDDRAAIRKIQGKVGVSVDGKYGAKTAAGVRAYQRKHGLTVDGAVGAKTWKKMFG